VTHDHPEGVKGAQAVASAIFLARNGASKDEIRNEVKARFGYHLDTPIDEIRPAYHFDVTCQGSVPQAIRAFLESEDFEDAVRKAVSLGGDSDTLACMAGSIAEAFYGGVPKHIQDRVFEILDPAPAEVVHRFAERYPMA
jgi:ADP-ribosylglycohydrolase